MTMDQEEMNHWEREILYFTTPDEAARFLMWFGRSDNREQIDERVIKGLQKEGNDSYRSEVAQSALSYFEEMVDRAQRLAGSPKATSVKSERLFDILVNIYLFHMQDDEFWTEEVPPELLEEIQRRANEYLKENI